MEEPRTIYIVTTGSYSDYSIFGVYSTRENAELAMSNAGPDEPQIEEYVLDSAIDHLARNEKLFTIFMDRDGTTDGYTNEATKGEETTALHPRYSGLQTRNVLVVSRWADRVEPVVKIANEHRARLIASGEWPVEEPLRIFIGKSPSS